MRSVLENCSLSFTPVNHDCNPKDTRFRKSYTTVEPEIERAYAKQAAKDSVLTPISPYFLDRRAALKLEEPQAA
jgi:hypothetical protein